MKVVILVGGRGQRLRPLTKTAPKPMVKVWGEPMLLHILNYFKSQGFVDFIFPLCYLPEVITQYFGDGSKFGVNIEYTYQDPNAPLGTAGAVSLSKKTLNETFIVTCGDAFRTLSAKELIHAHKSNGGLGTLALHKPKDEIVTSCVFFDKKTNKIKNFNERPTKEQLKAEKHVWMNSSLYIFEPDIFKYIEAGREVDFGKDVFPKALSDGATLFAFPSPDHVVDLGTLDKLKLVEKTWKSDFHKTNLLTP